jgi:hypothetical protein
MIESLVTYLPRGLGVFVMCLLVWYSTSLWRESRTFIQACRTAADTLKAALKSGAPGGMTRAARDGFGVAAQKAQGVAGEWLRRVDRDLERYEPGLGTEGWYLTRPVSEVLPFEAAAVGVYEREAHDGVPGILTSLGLFGTFAAILLALVGLRVNPETNTVNGIDALIEGLSGKFISSVAALLASLAFVMLHRHRERQVHRAYRMLASELSRVPYLSSNRVLLDIQRQGLDHSVSLSNISSDLVNSFVTTFNAEITPAFAGSVAEQLAPALDRLAETMSGLSATVARLEDSKQESVVGELRGLTESMQRAIDASLRDMGRQFSESLSGSASGQFDNASQALAASAQVLREMNAQFSGMQAALGTIIEEARSSTQSQLVAGRDQTAAMARLMEGLMERLNDSAQQNMDAVAGALTGVVGDLSNRVGALSADLVQRVGEAAERSQAVAGEVVENAGRWSSATQEKLERLLESMEARSQDFERAGTLLLSAQGSLRETLQQNQQALAAMGQAAGQVKSYSEALAGVGRNTENVQKQQAQTAVQVAEAVAQLRLASERNQLLLNQYSSVFRQSEETFAQLDERIGTVLQTILSRINDYNGAVENNFRAIVSVANDHVPRMADTFQNQVAALGEQMEELIEAMEGANRRLRV